MKLRRRRQPEMDARPDDGQRTREAGSHPFRRNSGKSRGDKTKNGVVGIYAHRDKSGATDYQIKYWKGGKMRCAYRSTRAAAENYAADLHLRLVGAEKPIRDESAIPFGEGINRGDWARLLWDGAVRVAAEPSNEEYQRALRAISVAASAAAKHVDNEAVNFKLSRVEYELKRARETRAAHRADGTFTESTPGQIDGIH